MPRDQGPRRRRHTRTRTHSTAVRQTGCGGRRRPALTLRPFAAARSGKGPLDLSPLIRGRHRIHRNRTHISDRDFVCSVRFGMGVAVAIIYGGGISFLRSIDVGHKVNGRERARQKIFGRITIFHTLVSSFFPSPRLSLSVAAAGRGPLSLMDS